MNQAQFSAAVHQTRKYSAVKVVTTSAEGLGRFPVLCLVNSLALLLTALAYTASRSGATWSTEVYWLSLLVIFVPTALRLISPTIARKERIALVVLLGCSLYLVKVLHSPLDFTFYDEFLHWETANHILQSGHLFSPNSLLPVSPLYPGLEVVTTAFANLSGLSIVESGILLLGIGRVAFMLALYLFYERIGGTAYFGGIAALLYTANSNFVFFDSQFSYESLSLPIAMTVLYAVANQMQETSHRRAFLQSFLLVLPLIVLVAVTHHLTGFVLAGFLFLWTLAALIRNRRERRWLITAAFALTALLTVVAWSLLVGNQVTSYLAPVFRSGVNELLNLLNPDSVGRELFRSASGQVSPLWERIVGIGAVVFILVVLPFGVLQIILSPFRRRLKIRNMVVIPSSVLQSWQRFRNSAAALAMAGIVLLHPLMQGFRLTSSGWEIANRSSEFLFWAIAFILAVGVLLVRSFSIPRRVWLLGFAVWSSVIFLGGTISGWPPWGRLPGEYLVSADTRSVEPEGILAARWTSEHLPASSRFGADRINSLLLGVYGNQRVITHLADGVYLASVFFSPTLGQSERDLLSRANAQYLLVDTRLSTSLPLVGVYFEAGEPRGSDRETPLSASALLKFNTIANVSRLFDSGDIKIYDVEGLSENSPTRP